MYQVSANGQMKFWEKKESKPDVVLKTAGQTFIVDTKWKIVDNAEPSDSDLKQIFAYNIFWNAIGEEILYEMKLSTIEAKHR